MALRAGPYLSGNRAASGTVKAEKSGTGSESHPYLGTTPLTRLLLGFASLLCLATASAAKEPPAATGAAIDESKVVKTYYVDPDGADAADDDKHGTQDSPFLTIKRALDAALRDKDAGTGAKIVIAPGTYRESIDIPAPARADTDAPLVIEASERDQTIIDAADTAGWTTDTWKPDGPALVHPWTPPRPASSPAPARGRGASERETTTAPTARRPVLLCLNGSPLRQVETAGALVPGSFCLVPGADHKNPDATLRALLPADEDADAAAEREFALGVRPHGMAITGRRNVVVRGLVFQHASEPGGPAASPAGLVLTGCANVLVEDVLSQWNDGAGLVIDGRASAPWSAGFTLRRVRLIHNGGSGLVATNLKNLLAEDCETSFNDFRGEWAGVFDPAGAAGVKARGLHGSTWRRHRAVSNPARGLWWAGDCTDLTLEDAVVRDNFFSGLLLEACPGPTVVRGCLVADNKLPPATAPGGKPEALAGAAVLVEASPDVTLENNVLAGNAMPQLALRNTAERAEPNFETGGKPPLRAERHVYRHNLLWGADAGQPLCALPSEPREGKGDFGFYYGTLDSDENCFWNPALPQAFGTYDHGGARVGMAMDAWRSFLASRAGTNAAAKPEGGSLWADPLLMEPAEGDYRLQTQSPLIDWGLPSEEGAVAQ